MREKDGVEMPKAKKKQKQQNKKYYFNEIRVPLIISVEIKSENV